MNRPPELTPMEHKIFYLLTCGPLAAQMKRLKKFSWEEENITIEDIRLLLEVSTLFDDGEEVVIDREIITTALNGLMEKGLVMFVDGGYSIASTPGATFLLHLLKEDPFSGLNPEEARICG